MFEAAIRHSLRPMASFPALPDSRLLRRHFSAELIASETARERPLAPEVRPLPAR